MLSQCITIGTDDAIMNNQNLQTTT